MLLLLFGEMNGPIAFLASRDFDPLCVLLCLPAAGMRFFLCGFYLLKKIINIRNKTKVAPIKKAEKKV